MLEQYFSFSPRRHNLSDVTNPPGSLDFKFDAVVIHLTELRGLERNLHYIILVIFYFIFILFY